MQASAMLANELEALLLTKQNEVLTSQRLHNKATLKATVARGENRE